MGWIVREEESGLSWDKKWEKIYRNYRYVVDSDDDEGEEPPDVAKSRSAKRNDRKALVAPDLLRRSQADDPLRCGMMWSLLSDTNQSGALLACLLGDASSQRIASGAKNSQEVTFSRAATASRPHWSGRGSSASRCRAAMAASSRTEPLAASTRKVKGGQSCMRSFITGQFMPQAAAVTVR